MNTAVLTERALQKTDWPLVERHGLTLTLSPLLSSMPGLTHAFTTRLGAKSPEPLNWFNLGRHITAEPLRQDAMENRRKLADALALDAAKLAVPGQMHTTNIYILADDCPPGQSLPDFDGIATDMVMRPILLHFADCVPVMAFDPKKGILCVMHAGWRGTAGGIVSKGIALMVDRFGCRPQDIAAAVGPAIGSCCYETGSEVPERLKQTVGNWQGLIETKHNKPHPDLKAFNAMQFLEAGVGDLDVTSWCTACHPEIFYSHRQSGGKTGRQGAIACIS